MKLSNIGIMPRVMLVLVVLAGLTLFTTTDALTRMSAVESTYAGLINQDAVALTEVARASRRVVSVGRDAYKLAGNTDEQVRSAIVSGTDKTVKELSGMLANARTASPRLAGDVAGFERDLDDMVTAYTQIVALSRTRGQADLIATIAQRLDVRLDPLRDRMGAFVSRVKGEMDARAAEA